MQFNNFLKSLLLCVLLLIISKNASGISDVKSAPASFRLSAAFTEDMITIDWPAVGNVISYNVYADYGEGFVKANPVPVTSRQRFVFVQADSAGTKKRVVKGHDVSLYVTALDGLNCSDSIAECREIFSSDTLRTRYFSGFSGIITEKQLKSVLTETQTSKRILPNGQSIRRQIFIRKFFCLSKQIAEIYSREINPEEEGACVPFSTIASIYLSANGLECYRAQGVFMSKFHSFNLVIINNVEYILDFTADQFLPESAPVLIPRDYCFIDSSGHASTGKSGISTPIYLIDKIYSSDQIAFNDSREASRYRMILDSLLHNTGNCH